MQSVTRSGGKRFARSMCPAPAHAIQGSRRQDRSLLRQVDAVPHESRVLGVWLVMKTQVFGELPHP
jgi:hypothetical protein